MCAGKGWEGAWSQMILWCGARMRVLARAVRMVTTWNGRAFLQLPLTFSSWGPGRTDDSTLPAANLAGRAELAAEVGRSSWRTLWHVARHGAARRSATASILVSRLQHGRARPTRVR